MPESYPKTTDIGPALHKSERISRIETLDIELPLAEPLRLGSLDIRSRTYTLVRLETESGIVGESFSLSRDLPIASIIRSQIAPYYLNGSLDDSDSLWRGAFDANLAAGRSGAIIKALSLVDIALWDAKAKASDKPLWALLGGARSQVPVMMVAGYPEVGIAASDAGDRVADYFRDGYERVKVARWAEPGDTRTLIESGAAGMADGDLLAVDAAWAWRLPGEAADEIESWGDVPLGWVEDPLPPEDFDSCVRLRKVSPQPIAYGDEASDRHLLKRLAKAGACDSLRFDATVIGGVTVVARLAAWCSEEAVSFSTHIYPELHVHFGSAWDSCTTIESFDPDNNRVDPSFRLLDRALPMSRGLTDAPTGPGIGVALDWELAFSLASEPVPDSLKAMLL
jgi:L-alanine-DL-glutamate epimerase-like enolase superfamily enzyme